MAKAVFSHIGRLFAYWQLEILSGMLFSVSFYAAVRFGYANEGIGWIAFTIYSILIILHQRSRIHKEWQIEELRRDIQRHLERLKRSLEKIHGMHVTLKQQKAELSKATEHLAHSQERVLSMSDLKNKFISTVSHELRTPVTAIQECLNLISEGVAGPVIPKQKEFLDVALRNVHRLTIVLNHLLDLSRLESGGMKTVITKLPLEQLVTESINTVRPKAQKKGIELIADVKWSLPPALVDRQRVVQVLNDLLDNAIKFTEAPGKAGVSVRLIEESHQLEVCVWDTGCGMTQEEVEQVFGRFYQVHKRQDYTAVPGAGLGLVICKEIITQLGGSIWVESQPGQGSRFYFTLQCYSDDALLRTHFQGAAREAQIRNSAMVFLGAHLRDHAALAKRYGNQAVEGILREVHSIVTSYFRTEDRVAVDYASGKIHVLMIAGEYNMGERIRRLDAYLRGKTFFANGEALSLVFAYGLAKFPQHGEDLASICKEIERQILLGGLDMVDFPLDGAA